MPVWPAYGRPSSCAPQVTRGRSRSSAASRTCPYNRPPLTKQALVAGPDVMTLMFPRRPSIENVRWTLGRRAVSVDLDGSTLSLDDGSTRDFDGLVIATGVRSRRLPIGEGGGPAPTLTLRTVDDALALHARLAPGARVVVIGAGFIGCEVAATVAARGGAVPSSTPCRHRWQGSLGPRWAPQSARGWKPQGWPSASASASPRCSPPPPVGMPCTSPTAPTSSPPTSSSRPSARCPRPSGSPGRAWTWATESAATATYW
ncbi:MAG: FAD-dependent oxidoreductase [Actinomycetales bacterium]|uniref:FAD-dependent oxidoreductase n=1 Tax=Candidatus Phosphoribacter hodrii TaxID=2953743 RepID=A0A9D7XYF0_9MICO|nr:FAD-dependent oxidoreductase [Candidatus Phosphoribacter hodrii]